MSEAHLSNDTFFEQLGELFDEHRKKDHGSVFLVQKCVIFDETDSRPKSSTSDLFQDLRASKPLQIIIRATNGKSRDHKADKIKASTVVNADALEAFFLRYAEVCKLGMSGLKKRDRSKGKKKLKAKKRKGGEAKKV